MSTAGQVVLVTGSSRGIGRAVALAFARRGARVVVNSVADVDGGRQTVEDIEAEGGQAQYVQADVGEPGDVERLFSVIEHESGAVDVLVNNAGVTESAPFAVATKEHWLRMLNVNLLSAVLCSQRAAASMLERGHGVIINTSSVRGFDANGREGIMAYSAAKAALNNFTRTLAKELAPTVRVNAIAPGFVATSYLDRVSSELKEAWLEAIPLKRFISPEELAEAYVFIAESPFTTGTIFAPDAGFTLGRS